MNITICHACKAKHSRFLQVYMIGARWELVVWYRCFDFSNYKRSLFIENTRNPKFDGPISFYNENPLPFKKCFSLQMTFTTSSTNIREFNYPTCKCCIWLVIYVKETYGKCCCNDVITVYMKYINFNWNWSLTDYDINNIFINYGFQFLDTNSILNLESNYYYIITIVQHWRSSFPKKIFVLVHQREWIRNYHQTNYN